MIVDHNVHSAGLSNNCVYCVLQLTSVLRRSYAFSWFHFALF